MFNLERALRRPRWRRQTSEGARLGCSPGRNSTADSHSASSWLGPRRQQWREWLLMPFPPQNLYRICIQTPLTTLIKSNAACLRPDTPTHHRSIWRSLSPQQAGQLFGNGMGMGNGNGSGNGMSADEDGKIYNLVIDLMDPGSREGALLELSKKREQYDELALVLWHSFGKPMALPIIIYVFDAALQVSCQLCCKKSFPFILYYHLQISPPMYLIASVMRSLFCNVSPRTRRLGSCFLTVEFLHTPFCD